MDLLQSYRGYPATKSCYLDGRYVNLALVDVEEFNPTPIRVRVVYGSNSELLDSVIASDFIVLRPGMNIIRVIIKSTYTMHSALLWLDTEGMTARLTDTVHGDIKVRKTRDLVYKLVEEYVNKFGNYEFSINNIVVPIEPEINPECRIAGFCNAYIIKQVLDYSADRKFNPNIDILKFTAAIEDQYKDQLPPGPPEIEYRWGGGGAGLGLGLGLLGGLAIGSVVAGGI